MNKELEKLYSLREIIRYAGMERVRNEDVAQHSFFVAAIVVVLHEHYIFDLGSAVLAAISHDIPEIGVGDVTHVVKVQNPELAAALSKAEWDFLKSMPTGFTTGYTTFNSESPEGLIVNLADCLQVLQYIESEIRLGHEGNMYKVRQGAINRANVYLQALENYARYDTTNPRPAWWDLWPI